MKKLGESSWSREEFEIGKSILDSDNHTMGEQVEQFELEFARYIGSKFAVMVNSGSSANLVAVSAMREKFGIAEDKNVVIVPATSWSTTYFPLVQCGYTLRFIDINAETFNIDEAQLYESLGDEVAGICIPHILGATAKIIDIQKRAKEKGIWIIEDTCESLGSSFPELPGRMAGTLGEIGTYSFFRSHHISTMEGGMLVTDDEDLMYMAKSIRAHGWSRNIPRDSILGNRLTDSWSEKFKFYLPGYNLRPLEISAAIGRMQLGKLDLFLKYRRSNADYLRTRIEALDFLKLQSQSVKYGSWMAFAFVLDSGNVDRREVVDLLTAKSFETRPIIAGNFLNQPVIKKMKVENFKIERFSNAERIDQHGFMMGNHGRDLTSEIDEFVHCLSLLK